METILLMVVAFGGYLLAYHTYGRFLARKIFKLNPESVVPSHEFKDGKDYVPTKRGIIFGHHFTSIAGTGPIVGPAIGVIWGWVPAMIWIFVGSIVMGAVHDFGSLVLSLRNQGKSVSDIASDFIGPRVKYVFFLVVFFELLIVIAIFGLVIAVIFAMFPASVFPIWMEVPIAVALGWFIYKRGANVGFSTFIAVFAMFVTVVIGHWLPFSLPALGPVPPTGVWIILLLIYAFVASTLPVTTLLQPRDYINAWQLFVAMSLLITGVFVAGTTANLEIVAPAFNPDPVGAPPILPFLFITIACGAISGFHSLVSSGTSAKQLNNERDAQAIGYGSMLMEAALATLVIITVAAGIGMAYETADGTILTGTAAWNTHYESWAASTGLGSKINAMVIGSANLIASFGIPKSLAVIIMGVFVASFAGTTLDSATRIQRYIIMELATNIKAPALKRKYPATAFAVITAAVLAFATGADGKGALTLWPLFGAVNQLLAALALLVLTLYLQRKGGFKYLVAAVPLVFMTFMTLWSVGLNELNFLEQGNWLLTLLNGTILLLSVWVVVEGLLVFFRVRSQAGTS